MLAEMVDGTQRRKKEKKKKHRMSYRSQIWEKVHVIAVTNNKMF